MVETGTLMVQTLFPSYVFYCIVAFIRCGFSLAIFALGINIA